MGTRSIMCSLFQVRKPSVKSSSSTSSEGLTGTSRTSKSLATSALSPTKQSSAASKQPPAKLQGPAQVVEPVVGETAGSDAAAAKNGTELALSTNEGGALTASLQLTGLPGELKELLGKIDVDRSNSIEWEEFLSYALSSNLTYGQIEELWRQLLAGRAADVAAELQGMRHPPQVPPPPPPPRPAVCASKRQPL